MGAMHSSFPLEIDHDVFFKPTKNKLNILPFLYKQSFNHLGLSNPLYITFQVEICRSAASQMHSQYKIYILNHFYIS